jgi:peptide/nickel transport system permease protein
MSPDRTAPGRIPRSRPGAAAGLVLLFIVASGLLAPWIVPFDPTEQRLEARLEGPSLAHPFGTDELGRDILSRVLVGSRVSIGVGASVVVLSAVTGVLIGGLAGFRGGRLDLIVTGVVLNALQAFPGILLAIALVAFMGPGIGKLILALSVMGWVGYARMARAQVLKVRALDFVEAAISVGASRRRVFRVHVLPNVVQPILVQASIGAASAILAEAFLSFIGLGIAPPNPSWGSMLNEGRNHLFDAPHMIVFPSLILMATVMSLNLLGDAVRDRLDPRSGVGGPRARRTGGVF